ncbi:MAG TPA: murein biosynthesis integral membrane protein MurJ, partial [Halomonas sp.]|nr:murein biosynthesis integral membrane protein MurJ [Halomonas sp.]
VQLVGGSVLMSVALMLVSPDWQVWLEFGLWQRVGWVAGLVVLGGGLYFIWLTALGLRLRHFKMNG